MSHSKTDGWAEWKKVWEHGTFIIRPPAVVREVVDPLRQTYDPASQAHVGAHITLTGPLLEPITAVDWAQCEQIVGEFNPFTIAYGPAHVWESGPVVWFEIQPADTILAIRDALHATSLCNLALPYTEAFIPHMTVLEGSTSPETANAIATHLNQMIPKSEFQCTEIVFIVPDAEFRFDVIRRLPLQAG